MSIRPVGRSADEFVKKLHKHHPVVAADVRPELGVVVIGHKAAYLLGDDLMG